MKIAINNNSLFQSRLTGETISVVAKIWSRIVHESRGTRSVLWRMSK